MEVNYLSIALGGLAFWILGALWYSPVLFGKAWQAEAGLSDEEIKKGNMPMIFGVSLILMMIMTYGIYYNVAYHSEEERTLVHGMFHGALAGICLAAASMGINYLYQRRSMKLFLIDGIYQVLGLALAGGVIAVMV